MSKIKWKRNSSSSSSDISSDGKQIDQDIIESYLNEIENEEIKE